MRIGVGLVVAVILVGLCFDLARGSQYHAYVDLAALVVVALIDQFVLPALNKRNQDKQLEAGNSHDRGDTSGNVTEPSPEQQLLEACRVAVEGAQRRASGKGNAADEEERVRWVDLLGLPPDTAWLDVVAERHRRGEALRREQAMACNLPPESTWEQIEHALGERARS